MSESIEVAHARYGAALHAVQSGVKAEQELDQTIGMAPDLMSSGPKHLRVGVNSALVGQGALATLLVAKGVLTEQEYFTALADQMEAEKSRYEDLLSERLGGPVTLV